MKERKRERSEYRLCVFCEARLPYDRYRCSKCGKWNAPTTSQNDETVLLSDVEAKPVTRIQTGPWDPCFGGSEAPFGLVVASVTLIGGAPGAGKSTMSLQLADCIAGAMEREVLYVATEETAEQIKDRGMRLELKHQNRLRLTRMGSAGDLGDILLERKPCAIIVDSLSGLTSDPDMAAEVAKRFKGYAGELTAPVILIDHINKEGDFAGLMKLQHNVDTTLALFPDDDQVRELTTIKNRFGPDGVEVRLEMTSRGLIPALEDEEDGEDE